MPHWSDSFKCILWAGCEENVAESAAFKQHVATNLLRSGMTEHIERQRKYMQTQGSTSESNRFAVNHGAMHDKLDDSPLAKIKEAQKPGFTAMIYPPIPYYHYDKMTLLELQHHWDPIIARLAQHPIKYMSSSQEYFGSLFDKTQQRFGFQIKSGSALKTLALLFNTIGEWFVNGESDAHLLLLAAQKAVIAHNSFEVYRDDFRLLHNADAADRRHVNRSSHFAGMLIALLCSPPDVNKISQHLGKILAVQELSDFDPKNELKGGNLKDTLLKLYTQTTAATDDSLTVLVVQLVTTIRKVPLPMTRVEADHTFILLVCKAGVQLIQSFRMHADQNSFHLGQESLAFARLMPWAPQTMTWLEAFQVLATTEVKHRGTHPDWAHHPELNAAFRHCFNIDFNRILAQKNRDHGLFDFSLAYIPKVFIRKIEDVKPEYFDKFKWKVDEYRDQAGWDRLHREYVNNPQLMPEDVVKDYNPFPSVGPLRASSISLRENCAS